MSAHPVTPGWREIGDRVFVRRYRLYDQNIGLVLGDARALVIDTRSSPRQADEVLRDAREVTARPIDLAINTHAHFDHCFGNQRLRPAPIYGHERCAMVLRASGERQRARLLAAMPERADEWREIVVDPPDRTFAETARIDLGGRIVELRHLGRGHTDNDVVVLVDDAGIVFAGDLLENGAPPSFTDAYPLDWPETASRLLELMRDAVVPGHGDLGDREFAEDQLAGFLGVAELGRRVRRGELSLDAAIGAGPYRAFGPDASREAIERAIAQLEGRLD